jgi:hypothetical protein
MASEPEDGPASLETYGGQPPDQPAELPVLDVQLPDALEVLPNPPIFDVMCKTRS